MRRVHLASYDELKENDFNLNIPRYVDTFEEEAKIDIEVVQQEIDTLEGELAEVRGKMAKPVLEYSSWDKLKAVIRKAIKASDNSGIESADHFSQVGKKVTIGSGAERHIPDYDYHLSRYACYLIIQNGDPTKPVIANGQTYFALQTRRQELDDDLAFQQLEEDKKRVFIRNELKEHNKQLVEAANQAGVESGLDFAIFQNHGYQGLYGGVVRYINRKHWPPSQKHIRRRWITWKGNCREFLGSSNWW
jgi:hypothetical protein